MIRKIFALLIIALCMIAVPAAATITQNTTTNGSYTIQTFTSNLGTVTAPANETTTFIIPTGVTQIEYLVVAGGGGGAAGHVGGGGGAGGYLTNYGNATAISAGTTVNIAIGLGGNGGADGSYTNPASNGGTSVFNNIVAVGGGRGGYYSGGAGQPGGSGGGGAYSGGIGGANVTGQGFAGGTSGSNGGGGGGGASVVGGTAIGYGGNGSVNYIRGIGAQIYSGGGGGGTVLDAPGFIGGSGGGGAGGTNGGTPIRGINGTDTLGGGGGGGGFTPIRSGGGGGSGIVVIRYLTPASGVTANFTASQLSGVYPFTATFTSDSTGSPITYNWSVNGAVEATTQNYTRLFNNGGNFTVNLTVTATGSTSTASKVITVFNQTVGGFAANVTSGSRPLAVLFTDSSSNATSWYYEFGDGNTSTSQSPTFTYNIAGVYSVNQRVTNSANVSWYNRTNYITVSNGLYAITANFTATNQTGEIPLVTTLTDASTYFNSTPATYFWDFGDGTNSTSRNVSHTFTTAGAYSVNYTVTNATEGISSSKIMIFTATSPSGFNQQDIEMSPTFRVLLRFTDSTTSAPVVGATVVLGTSSNTTDSSGYVTFWSSYELASFVASASGYYGTSGSFVVDEDMERAYQMVPLTESVQNTNTVYTQHFISFRVVDMYRRPLSPVTVTAYYVNTSLPAGSSIDYLTKAFGIDATVAASMLNSSVALQGTTGTDGKIGFVMFPAIQYTVQAVNSTMGAACQITAYPTDSDYLMYCPLQSQSVVQNNTATQIAGSYVWITEPNNSFVTFNAQYQDPLGITSDLWFNVTCPDNQTVMFQDHPGNPGTSLYQRNFTLPNVRGTQINAYLKYNRSA